MKPPMTRGELRVIADTDHVQCGDAATMANMLLELMGGWIKCSERMPEVCKDVLIYVTSPNEVLLAYLSHGGEFCYDTDGDGEQLTCKATHWMPLPAAPGDDL